MWYLSQSIIILFSCQFTDLTHYPSTILFEQFDPTALGKLVALYEHCVFSQSVIWGIDSFDQWGVELGKALVSLIIPEIESETKPKPKLTHDSSTNTLIKRYWESKSHVKDKKYQLNTDIKLGAIRLI
jgi:Phosphoglucose isomerase